jgi:PRTRC genetic system protein B
MKQPEIMMAEDPFIPQMAIVVYSDGKDNYLEQHTIEFNRKKPIFGPGKPLLEDTISTIMGTISKDLIQHHDNVEVIPENILLNCQIPGKMNIIWYLLKPKRKLLFRNVFVFNTEKPVQLPNLLFQWHQRTLFIYAFKENKLPGFNTKFFKGPFPNTSTNGSVCLGSAVVNTETKSLKTFISSAENAFFNSEFNHGGTGNVTGSFNAVWEETYKTGIFDPKSLISTDIDLNNLLRK